MLNDEEWELLQSIHEKTSLGQLLTQTVCPGGSGYKAWNDKYGKGYAIPAAFLKDMFTGGVDGDSRVMLLSQIDNKDCSINEALKACRKIKDVAAVCKLIEDYYEFATGQKKDMAQLKKLHPQDLSDESICVCAANYKVIRLTKAVRDEAKYDTLSELEKLTVRLGRMGNLNTLRVCKAITKKDAVAKDSDDAKFEWYNWTRPDGTEVKFCIVCGEVSAEKNGLLALP